MGGEFDPGPVPYTFEEIDHELIFTVIFLPSADSFNKDCCHMLLKYTNRFFKPCPWEIRVLMNRLSVYKTESAVSNIVGSLYF